jgi:hypothetical protein
VAGGGWREAPDPPWAPPPVGPRLHPLSGSRPMPRSTPSPSGQPGAGSGTWPSRVTALQGLPSRHPATNSRTFRPSPSPKAASVQQGLALPSGRRADPGAGPGELSGIGRGAGHGMARPSHPTPVRGLAQSAGDRGAPLPPHLRLFSALSGDFTFLHSEATSLRETAPPEREPQNSGEGEA